MSGLLGECFSPVFMHIVVQGISGDLSIISDDAGQFIVQYLLACCSTGLFMPNASLNV